MARKKKKRSGGIHPTIWVAIVTGIVTILVGLFNFPPFINFVNNLLSDPTPTAIVFITETTPSATYAIETATVETNPTQTETIQPVFTDTPTAPPETQFMIAQVTASASEGKVPFTVNYNAKNSYVDVQGGDDLFCTFERVCNYTWSVRLDGKNVYGPTLGESSLSYTYNSRGSYMVVVNVCRGRTQDICNFAFAYFTAK